MADNVPVLACLAFLRLVLHSTDAFAKGYLALGPLADLANTLGDPGGRDRLLGVLTLEGYEAFFGRLVPVFTALPALAPSEKAALQNLLEAARNFDLEGRGSAQAFEDYVFGWSSPQVESPDFVQVMTIHRAKGLEWDLVLLPELDSRGAGGSETLVAREGGLGDGVAWILEPPPAFVLEADPVLSERKDQARRREHYEAACLFYVAMTRAATALYLVGPEPSAKSEALNQATILRDTVGPFTGQTWTPGGAADSFNFLACWGSPDWYKNRVARTPPAPPAPVAQAAEAVPGAPRTRRLPVARPGRDLGGSVSAEKVFKGSAEARDTGNLVHELFSSLEFLEEGAAPQAVQAFRAARGATLPPETLDETIQTFSAALALPRVQQLLTRRDPQEVVWRERAFEMVLEGRWYSGVFDRVTVVGEGADAKVLLLDYKTGHSPKGQPPEQYRQQLMAYRQALKALLGLANLAQVDTRLLYTREGAVFSLDVEGKWS
jgi:ATP-dependent exoDNAse (exonuclease V) beta subunit